MVGAIWSLADTVDSGDNIFQGTRPATLSRAPASTGRHLIATAEAYAVTNCSCRKLVHTFKARINVLCQRQNCWRAVTVVAACSSLSFPPQRRLAPGRDHPR